MTPEIEVDGCVMTLPEAAPEGMKYTIISNGEPVEILGGDGVLVPSAEGDV